MKVTIFLIIGLVISGSVFMNLSIKYNWSMKLWVMINMKIKSTWNVSLYIILAVMFELIIQIVLGSFIDSKELLKLFFGITMGLVLAFMPVQQMPSTIEPIDTLVDRQQQRIEEDI